jgi:MATE family multidrug resistance protein
MVFANAATPLASVADTFVIGAVGDKDDIAGVALGAVLFNIFYWSFYFLRMSTTGLAAQAEGANDQTASQLIVLRALTAALAIGLIVLVLRGPAAALGFWVLQGEAKVERLGEVYFSIRALGAIGAFASFALTGWLIGAGRTREVLAVTVVYSAVNIGLDFWFVFGLNLGVAGVAWATAIADVLSALMAGLVVHLVVQRRGGWRSEARAPRAVFDPSALKQLFAVNLDLMIRTWSLVISFSWFANIGAKLGAAVLAGNHVLLQIVSVWAFVLDAYAFVAESEVGRAFGAKSVSALRRAIRLTSEFAFASGFLFMIATFAFGPALLDAWIADEEARASALRFLPYCAAIPFFGAAAWQLDGIFIGATRSAAMRNAGIASALIYLALDRTLTPNFGAHGAWTAFLLFYLARAGALAADYPALERDVKA